ncbi:MAG: hypothetical protein AAF468_12765 [Pseudomonadota bacterium]
MSLRSLLVKSALAILAVPMASVAYVSEASADSCWNHNGSLMRLQASGNRRWFYYEDPKPTLRRAGVRRGTLLFNGRKSGNYYIGTARRFSRFCPGTPLEYRVEGPVTRDQLKVTIFGSYEVHRRCEPTGQFRDDQLVFTYVRQC